MRCKSFQWQKYSMCMNRKEKLCNRASVCTLFKSIALCFWGTTVKMGRGWGFVSRCTLFLDMCPCFGHTIYVANPPSLYLFHCASPSCCDELSVDENVHDPPPPPSPSRPSEATHQEKMTEQNKNKMLPGLFSFFLFFDFGKRKMWQHCTQSIYVGNINST